MKNLLKLTLIFGLALSVTLTSCKKEEEEENEHNDAYGDVFVKKVQTPGGVKYGLVYYSGGEGLKTCTVKTPSGEEFTLAEFWKGKGSMRFHPASSEMVSSMPAAGDYTFTFTFDDEVTKTIVDPLTSEDFGNVMSGVTVTHTPGSEEVTVNWATVDGADNYFVKLTDKNKNDNKPIFVNMGMPATTTSYTFSKSTTDASPGWMQAGKPATGDTCYVMIVGVKYEAGATGPEASNNKQIATMKPTMIIW